MLLTGTILVIAWRKHEKIDFWDTQKVAFPLDLNINRDKEKTNSNTSRSVRCDPIRFNKLLIYKVQDKQYPG